MDWPAETLKDTCLCLTSGWVCVRWEVVVGKSWLEELGKLQPSDPNAVHVRLHKTILRSERKVLMTSSIGWTFCFLKWIAQQWSATTVTTTMIRIDQLMFHDFRAKLLPEKGQRYPSNHLYSHDGHTMTVLNRPRLFCSPSIQVVEMSSEWHGYSTCSMDPSDPWGTGTVCIPTKHIPADKLGALLSF
jgi:hypothetical protein